MARVKIIQVEMPAFRLQTSVAYEPREIVSRTLDLASRRQARGNNIQVLLGDLERAHLLALTGKLPIAAGSIAISAGA